MKSWILCLLLACSVTSVLAQHDPPPPDMREWAKDTVAPYQKEPVVPVFNIRLMDSVTIFNTYNIPKGNPVAIIIFDPECKHCKYTLGNLMKGMDSVSDVQFYLVTPTHSMTLIRNFYTEHHMGEHKNIRAVGRDYEFFCFSHYRARTIPDIALYDKDKKLIKFISGDFSATDIYKLVHPQG